jgi:hypothetical protein
MGTRTRFSRRTVTVLALSAVLVAGTYAYTAANTVPTSKAGDGSGAVSGYTVSAIHYNLNAASPQNVDSVTFTLNSAPVAGSTIKAQVDGATWYTCTNVTTAVTCATTAPQATVLGATSLRVIVAD